MDIKQLILAEMGRRNMTAYRLAKQSGIKASTLYAWLNGQNENLNSDALGTLLEVLEIELKGK